MTQSTNELYAALYDTSGVGWNGEMDFYRQYAAEAKARRASVLEVACGTGRIAIPLAQEGLRVAGFDISPYMIGRAREKSSGMEDVRWEVADMRSFDLGEQFGLVLIPGHAFQSICTPGEQVACLERIHRHLLSGGRLIAHIDNPEVDWLGGLPAKDGVFEAGQTLTHPQSGRSIRVSDAWTYERATQTAWLLTAFEELAPDGSVIQRQEQGPINLHVVFRFEMEHLLRRVGFSLEALYGDFLRSEFRGDSTQMIWVARKE